MGAPDGSLKVLFVDSSPALGGAEMSLLLALEHLDRRRIRPLLACPPGPLLDGARSRGLPAIPCLLPPLRPWWSPAGWVRLFVGAGSLTTVVRREQVQLIHSNTMRASFYVALAARLSGRPFAWHVRDIYQSSWYTRSMSRAARAVIAISEAAARPLGPRAEILHNPVDWKTLDELPTEEQARRLLGLPPAGPIVTTIGRITRWKRQDLFLRAAGVIAEALPDAQFLVVGGAIFGDEGSYERELRALPSQLGIEGQVHFTGHLTDIRPPLAAAEVVVHCAEVEPFGRVIAEAMAAGKAVVAVDEGAASELLGTTGRVVSPSTPEALAQAISALLGEHEERARLGWQARERARVLFDPEAHARRLESILLRAVAG